MRSYRWTLSYFTKLLPNMIATHKVREYYLKISYI